MSVEEKIDIIREVYPPLAEEVEAVMKTEQYAELSAKMQFED